MTKSERITLMESYEGEYSEDYCKKNSLFISYTAAGAIKFKTRSLIDFQKDVIRTDTSFILGSWQTVNSDKDGATDVLKAILDDNSWDKMKFSIVEQGLILGLTAIRVGRDQDNVRFSLVDLTETEIEPIEENGRVIGWELQWNQEGKYIKEEFLPDSYKRYENSKLVLEAANQYEMPWLIVIANRTSITEDEWYGISEWEDIRNIVDEINSTLSRVSAIEDLYANPKLLITGASEADFTKDDNFFFVPDASGTINFLEFSGQVFPSILEKIRLMISTVKDKCPELILNDLGQLSGYALKLKLEKLNKKIGQLRQSYFAGFEQLFSLLYQMQENTEADFEIVAEDAVPRDSEGLATELLNLHINRVISLKTMTEELGYNYDDEQEQLEKEGL